MMRDDEFFAACEDVMQSGSKHASRALCGFIQHLSPGEVGVCSPSTFLLQLPSLLEQAYCRWEAGSVSSSVVLLTASINAGWCLRGLPKVLFWISSATSHSSSMGPDQAMHVSVMTQIYMRFLLGHGGLVDKPTLRAQVCRALAAIAIHTYPTSQEEFTSYKDILGPVMSSSCDLTFINYIRNCFFIRSINATGASMQDMTMLMMIADGCTTEVVLASMGIILDERVKIQPIRRSLLRVSLQRAADAVLQLHFSSSDPSSCSTVTGASFPTVVSSIASFLVEGSLSPPQELCPNFFAALAEGNCIPQLLEAVNEKMVIRRAGTIDRCEELDAVVGILNAITALDPTCVQILKPAMQFAASSPSIHIFSDIFGTIVECLLCDLLKALTVVNGDGMDDADSLLIQHTLMCLDRAADAVIASCRGELRLVATPAECCRLLHVIILVADALVLHSIPEMEATDDPDDYDEFVDDIRRDNESRAAAAQLLSPKLLLLRNELGVVISGLGQQHSATGGSRNIFEVEALVRTVLMSKQSRGPIDSDDWEAEAYMAFEALLAAPLVPSAALELFAGQPLLVVSAAPQRILCGMLCAPFTGWGSAGLMIREDSAVDAAAMCLVVAKVLEKGCVDGAASSSSSISGEGGGGSWVTRYSAARRSKSSNSTGKKAVLVSRADAAVGHALGRVVFDLVKVLSNGSSGQRTRNAALGTLLDICVSSRIEQDVVDWKLVTGGATEDINDWLRQGLQFTISSLQLESLAGYLGASAAAVTAAVVIRWVSQASSSRLFQFGIIREAFAVQTSPEWLLLSAEFLSLALDLGCSDATERDVCDVALQLWNVGCSTNVLTTSTTTAMDCLSSVSVSPVASLHRLAVSLSRVVWEAYSPDAVEAWCQGVMQSATHHRADVAVSFLEDVLLVIAQYRPATTAACLSDWRLPSMLVTSLLTNVALTSSSGGASWWVEPAPLRILFSSDVVVASFLLCDNGGADLFGSLLCHCRDAALARGDGSLILNIVSPLSMTLSRLLLADDDNVVTAGIENLPDTLVSREPVVFLVVSIVQLFVEAISFVFGDDELSFCAASNKKSTSFSAEDTSDVSESDEDIATGAEAVNALAKLIDALVQTRAQCCGGPCSIKFGPLGNIASEFSDEYTIRAAIRLATRQ